MVLEVALRIVLINLVRIVRCMPDITYICNGNKCGENRPSVCYMNNSGPSVCWHTTDLDYSISHIASDFPPVKTQQLPDSPNTLCIIDIQYELVDEEATIEGLERGETYSVPKELVAINESLKNFEND